MLAFDMKNIVSFRWQTDLMYSSIQVDEIPHRQVEKNSNEHVFLDFHTFSTVQSWSFLIYGHFIP